MQKTTDENIILLITTTIVAILTLSYLTVKKKNIRFKKNDFEEDIISKNIETDLFNIAKDFSKAEKKLSNVK